jgi:tight adherence protein C
MSPIVIAAAAFLAVCCLGGMVALLFGGEKNRLDERLNDLSSAGGGDPRLAEQAAMKAITKRAMPTIGAMLTPEDEKERTALKARLVMAGFYNPQAPAVFVAVKVMMTAVPLVLGLGLYPFMGTRGAYAIGGAVIFALFGMVGPSMWLDSRKGERQTSIRRSLPDAMDVIVICIEGGLSLPAALARVAEEMRIAHPLLAFEFNIVQREIQLGKNTGNALKELARRTDLEEIRGLAAVIQQAEKFGSSMAKALRVHADTLRLKRSQKAEEMAAKAGTKILFPTLLFIFPAIFVVILGPAAFDIMAVLGNVGK